MQWLVLPVPFVCNVMSQRGMKRNDPICKLLCFLWFQALKLTIAIYHFGLQAVFACTFVFRCFSTLLLLQQTCGSSKKNLNRTIIRCFLKNFRAFIIVIGAQLHFREPFVWKCIKMVLSQGYMHVLLLLFCQTDCSVDTIFQYLWYHLCSIVMCFKVL